MATAYGDEIARGIAAQWQSSGTVGSVLAQLASTGQADAADLEADMWATVSEARRTDPRDTQGVYDAMVRLGEHLKVRVDLSHAG